jgi:UDP-GlcNAc:undecaprenyl-phosphate GlcNAc-1-phosphate transferase
MNTIAHFYPFLSSFFLTLGLVLLASKIFRKLQWLDSPELFGYKRRPIPYGIGIVFLLNFLFLAAFFLPWSIQLVALLFSGTILTVISCIDDRIKLSPWIRLIIQLCSALLVVLAGINVPAITNPFGDPFVLDGIVWTLSIGGMMLTIAPMAALFAMLWIVFVMNSMNWLDGAPGIVSGMSTIACAVLYFLATESQLHVIDQTTLAIMALIVGGGTFAFLCFDFPKPKILMGDSGTMFLGFMIAVMAIYSGGKLATAFIVLAIPILDAAWTIIRRLINKQSPLKGDFQHFHHELMKAGLSERQVNLFYYSISLGFGIVALTLESLGKFIAIIILFGIMAGVRLFMAISSKSSSPPYP